VNGPGGVVVHDARVLPLLRERYGARDLDALERLLASWGALELPALPNGLYAAVARPAPGAEDTGYGHTWVRDTVHVAHVAWERGENRAEHFRRSRGAGDGDHSFRRRTLPFRRADIGNPLSSPGEVRDDRAVRQELDLVDQFRG
jgi:hypothetical protein